MKVVDQIGWGQIGSIWWSLFSFLVASRSNFRSFFVVFEAELVSILAQISGRSALALLLLSLLLWVESEKSVVHVTRNQPLVEFFVPIDVEPLADYFRLTLNTVLGG